MNRHGSLTRTVGLVRGIRRAVLFAVTAEPDVDAGAKVALPLPLAVASYPEIVIFFCWLRIKT